MSNEKTAKQESAGEVGSTELLAERDELKKNNEALLKRLATYREFCEGLTRGENKDKSFVAMMDWNPSLCYEIAGNLGDNRKAKKFLFYS